MFLTTRHVLHGSLGKRLQAVISDLQDSMQGIDPDVQKVQDPLKAFTHHYMYSHT